MKTLIGILLYLHMGSYVPALREAFPIAKDVFKVVWPLVKQEEQKLGNRRAALAKRGTRTKH